VEGNHIMYREFSFVSATPHNRASFVFKFYESFKHMLNREGKILFNLINCLFYLISLNYILILRSHECKRVLFICIDTLFRFSD
jgi:hypothetical protein